MRAKSKQILCAASATASSLLALVCAVSARMGPSGDGWGFIPDLAATADAVVVGRAGAMETLANTEVGGIDGHVFPLAVQVVVFQKTNWLTGTQPVPCRLIGLPYTPLWDMYLWEGTNYMVFLKRLAPDPETAAAFNLTGQVVFTLWPDNRSLFRNPTKDQIEAARAFTKLRQLETVEEKIARLKVLAGNTNNLKGQCAYRLLHEIEDVEQHGGEYGLIAPSLIQKSLRSLLEGGPLLRDLGQREPDYTEEQLEQLRQEILKSKRW